MIWISLLAFFVVDAYIEHLREFKAGFYGKPGVNHYISTAFRIVYFADLVWRFHVTDTWHLFCFGVGGFFDGWLLMNIFINLFGGHKWYELGETAWLDKLEKNYQRPIIIAKVIFGVLGVVLFYR